MVINVHVWSININHPIVNQSILKEYRYNLIKRWKEGDQLHTQNNASVNYYILVKLIIWQCEIYTDLSKATYITFGGRKCRKWLKHLVAHIINIIWNAGLFSMRATDASSRSRLWVGHEQSTCDEDDSSANRFLSRSLFTLHDVHRSWEVACMTNDCWRAKWLYDVSIGWMTFFKRK